MPSIVVRQLCLLHEVRATKWIEQGEKPTKYFFNLEKRNYNRKVIRSLKKPDGESITDELEILKEIELYYRNLYSSAVDRRNDLFEEFVGDLAIPKLEDTVRDELEGEITLKECQDILIKNQERFIARRFGVIMTPLSRD